MPAGHTIPVEWYADKYATRGHAELRDVENALLREELCLISDKFNNFSLEQRRFDC